MPLTISIHPVPWDHSDSITLRALQRTEINALGGSEPGIAPSAADVAVFLIAYLGAEPVGCGGLRALSSTSAEVKRMFVSPAHRGLLCDDEGAGSGTSVAMLLMGRLESEASARGWRALMLETGTFLVKARRFYERCGFVECEKFGPYIEAGHSVCYNKDLGR